MKKPIKTQFVNRQSDAIAQPVSSLAHRRVSSGKLFGAQEEIVIEHNSEEYRLRITKNDKLILTK